MKTRIEVVTIHEDEIALGHGTKSVGHEVDNMLQSVLEAGDLLSKFTIDFDDADREVAKQIYASHEGGKKRHAI